MHKAKEATEPMMNQGFKLRILATNWNRFDVAAIDFGGAGRASEVLPVLNHVATALTPITAAPGKLLKSSYIEDKLNRVDTMLNFIDIFLMCIIYHECVSKATAVTIQ